MAFLLYIYAAAYINLFLNVIPANRKGLFAFKFVWYSTKCYKIYYLSIGRVGSKPKKIDISVSDRVSVFLELAEAHRILDQQVNATGLLCGF